MESNIKRIVAFGCSATSGQGLEDNKFSWPLILGNKLNLDVDNRGIPGASNTEILYNILNYKFLETDLIINLWTFPIRDVIFNENGFRQIGAWDNDDLVKHYFLVHSEYDIAIRSWYSIHQATLYLNKINLKSLNLLNDYNELIKYKPSYIDVSVCNIRVEKLKIDKATDNFHPGIKSHINIANAILAYLI
jgi:lysophospholipase L1-like esterase